MTLSLGSDRFFHPLQVPCPLDLLMAVSALRLSFPAFRNGIRRRVRVFPLAEIVYAAASAISRSPKWCTPPRPRFPARRNDARRRVRVFPLSEISYAAASAFSRSPKWRTPPHPYFPARQNNALHRATRIFPLAETTRSTPRTFFRSPKRRGARYSRFFARRNDAEKSPHRFGGFEIAQGQPLCLFGRVETVDFCRFS